MRLFSVRLIVSLIIGITLVSLLSSYYEVLGEKRALRRDLERRSDVLGESLVSNVERSWERDSGRDLQRIVQRFGNREHLIGIAVYDLTSKLVAATPDLANKLGAPPALLSQAINKDESANAFVRMGQTQVEMYALPVHRDDKVVGGLVIVHDASYIREQNMKTWRESFLRVLLQVLVISVITLLIVRWSIAGPIARAAQWMRALRMGRLSLPQEIPDLDVFRPLAREVKTFAKSLSQARSAAETEARLRDAGESLWTPERLAIHIQGRLDEGKLIVVSNREPYMHVRNGKTIECIVPASGLVTALEPILRACSGTWVAHGSGDGDQETVDRYGHLRVPPEDPNYTLRRVWLTKEEEQGYYYGFANEGLWPLCHIAHTRPIFRASDWQNYFDANQKFADAVVEEIADSLRPVILVQDYHFALLPRLIKMQRPDARVAIFWHIPWPNSEAFAICPWRRELLEGLLGADLIGFHIQSHCNNFLETVDRTLESRIDWEHFSASRLDHHTMVRPFPISVDLVNGQPESVSDSSYTDRSALLKSQGIESTFLGVGVDRIDYTKGILERFLAIERFLEKWPVYRGQFTFVQIGAPSRTHIKRYHDFLGEVELEAERINWRFQTGKWKPILFLKRQHSHEEITKYYRAADICLVISLHDGMNFVAKGFVVARSDEGGVLVLSQFTGAARELRDALLVNPYDIDETADALRRALEMEPEEKELRMQRMRRTVKENNVYRWAANLVAELCELRLDESEVTQEKVRSIASAS